jgi:hypothetical protein
MADETPVLVEGDTHYVPRYILKDDNGMKFQSDDPEDGVVVADLRPE